MKHLISITQLTNLSEGNYSNLYGAGGYMAIGNKNA